MTTIEKRIDDAVESVEYAADVAEKFIDITYVGSVSTKKGPIKSIKQIGDEAEVRISNVEGALVTGSNVRLAQKETVLSAEVDARLTGHENQLSADASIRVARIESDVLADTSRIISEADSAISRLAHFSQEVFVAQTTYTEPRIYFIDEGIAYAPLAAPYVSGLSIAVDKAEGKLTVLQGLTDSIIGEGIDQLPTNRNIDLNIKYFDGLSDAVEKVKENPFRYNRVSISSRRTRQECVADGVSYPDGGAAEYLLKSGFTPNGMSIISASLDNTVSLVYVMKDFIKAEQLGVTYSGADESNIIHHALSLGPTAISKDVVVNSTYLKDGEPAPLITFNGSDNVGVGRNVAMDFSKSSVTGNSKTDHYVGSSTRRHHLVAGVIRRDVGSTHTGIIDANNWAFINDTTHIPLNINMSLGDNPGTTQGACELVNSGTNLKIHYFGKRLNSLVITPDETFAKKGLTCGNSTGYNLAILSFSAPCVFELDLQTLLLSNIDESIWGAKAGNSRFGVTVSASGFVTISHPSMQNPAFEALVSYKSSNSLADMFDPVYVETNGGSTTCLMRGEFEGSIRFISGSGWSVSSLASHDAADFTLLYDDASGVLTVTHPAAFGITSPTCQITGKIGSASGSVYRYGVFDEVSTGFKVKIADDNGVVQQPNSSMYFSFNRGRTARVAGSKLAGKLRCNIGTAQPLAKDITSSSGNFWIMGVMEY